MSAANGKTTLNLSINAEIKRRMKISCAETGDDVSAVTEALYVKFLGEHTGTAKDEKHQNLYTSRKNCRYR